MSHSTNVGLNGPGMCSDSGRELPCVPIDDDFQSLVVVGVGHWRTAVPSPSPLLALRPARLLFPRTVGVGHIFTWSTNCT